MGTKVTKIVLKDMPKVSLNAWYASEHWSKRKKIKDTYAWLVKSKVKGKFSKDKQYNVDYVFGFKRNPLDATNTVAILKILEDLLFEDDKYDIILKVSMCSIKAKEDFIEITVKEI
jgi:hypothetical protein